MPIRASLSEVALPFLLSRMLCVGIIMLSSQVHWESVPAREGINRHAHITLEKDELFESFERVWRSADASWYLGIAEEGYHKIPYTSKSAHNWVFFPMYPLLTRLLAYPLGSHLVAGLILSNLCLLFSLCVLSELAKLQGYSARKRQTLVALIAFFPTSYFFSAAITESLFLLFSLSAFYELERKKIGVASCFMFGACLSRPTGLLLLPAFALGIWLRNRASNWISMLWLLLPLSGVALFCTYLYSICGNPLAFSDNQNAWGRSTSGSFILPNPETLLTWSAAWNFSMLNFTALCLSLFATAHCVRRKRISWALFLAVPVLIAVSTGTLQSLTRFVMVLFPVHFAVAEVIHDTKYELALIALYAALLGILSLGYGTHVTMAMA